MTESVLVLAQTTQPAPARPGGPDSMFSIFGIMLAFVVFMWVLNRGKRKERDKYDQMLKNLKRNDRVQTIGGIIGTVVDVKDNEVVLKVDESSNVKIRFNRSAIKEVIQETPAVTETK